MASNNNNILQTWQNTGDLESKYFCRNKKKTKSRRRFQAIGMLPLVMIAIVLQVAIKKIARPFQSAVHAKRTYRELRMLKHMVHENVRL